MFTATSRIMSAMRRVRAFSTPHYNLIFPQSTRIMQDFFQICRRFEVIDDGIASNCPKQVLIYLI
jgi:hypothetical protein